MKRTGQLWDTLISFDNLYLAYRKAMRGKRFHPNVARFMFDAEDELWRLHEELREKTYRPGGYRTFYVYERKSRLISAAPFRDRVVHHALCNLVEPLFERRFIFDTYANRIGKGQHRAVARAQQFARQYAYVLKCDIKRYFPTIDHDILYALLSRVIKCPDTLWLAERIIAGSNPQEPVRDYFPGDDLWTPFERRKGLPLGNQTSQFFANVYLNPLDHFVKRTLQVAGYVRYVDDFLLFADNKAQLWAWKQAIETFLASYRLRLKPQGVILFRVTDGIPFLGYRVFPAVILVNRQAILRFRRLVKHERVRWRARQVTQAHLKCVVFGCMGHLAQATTSHLREQLLEEAWF